VNDQSTFRSSSQSGHMRTAYHTQGILRTLPLERPRGGSQEKTAASSVSERNEIADSEYCRSLQSPRRTRTRVHSGKMASKMVEGHRERRPQPRSVNVGMIQGDCLRRSNGREGVCEKQAVVADEIRRFWKLTCCGPQPVDNGRDSHLTATITGSRL
jgi:hypothetical protein